MGSGFRLVFALKVTLYTHHTLIVLQGVYRVWGRSGWLFKASGGACLFTNTVPSDAVGCDYKRPSSV